MRDIIVRRVYDGGPFEGTAFLVDGMWPRGVRKDELERVRWVRDLAPSAELRRWFGHRPERFAEFRRRYREELDGEADTVQPLLEAARGGKVTLLYAARDTEHNNAVVLREYLRDRLAGPDG
ncbi:DUF488 domain-containing protein [Streptosporangium sp. NPDC004379]|uniref:DUF488 domain-containing protein n=1 Tax=Streptosporangium sp. NPDC004379 TaxID=3366189 RepID=UPI0036853064